MRTTLTQTTPLGADLGSRVGRGLSVAFNGTRRVLARGLELLVEARHREAEREIERIVRLHSGIPDEIRQQFLKRPSRKG
ncbi:hypothetical protein HW532_11545 [Kaustia mangrovi]|uniref:Uncharacterized protein n=1 Tax=Kaustia mangrovi TaxID=2593653 RepID=A0A7S8C4J5_9HYPH|nr:hypothetical protein [Kaustia mangrovi]QPC43270.1 hypothetical protein HW532_11545 [Kaustia mangrovi]